VSAYLLEPCDLECVFIGSRPSAVISDIFNRYRRSKGQAYGVGRDRLPRNLAVPLKVVADKIGARPFMEYAMVSTAAREMRNAHLTRSSC
jgi:indoleamine 2,3-dioxygenase